MPALFLYEKDLPEILEEIGVTVLAGTAAFVYRPLPERFIVGKVHFMSYNEVRKKSTFLPTSGSSILSVMKRRKDEKWGT